MKQEQELVIIGDRVLIEAEEGKAQTAGGLYLPQGVAEKEKIQSGLIVKIGPGYIIPHAESSEPWVDKKNEPKYVPLQVQVGDHALFMRKEAVEIEYQSKKLLIVPQHGILAVVRDTILKTVN
ncbi:MAG: co-chaperone GroES [Chitinivibrionales bacterium]|nr:co-chaperone GroES [Chitinivibrionales bacterium]